MYKSLLTTLLLVCSATFAAESAPSDKDKPNYVPEVAVEQVPWDEITSLPKLAPDGVYKACDTLRGDGFVVISIGEGMYLVEIHCPVQPMKDI